MKDFDKRWEEYSLLQNKVDKIGEFRFRIKNWAVTLMVATVLGGVATKVPNFYYLFIIPVIFAFQIFEKYQVRLLKAFSTRLQKIEESFNQIGDENFEHPKISQVSIEALSLVRGTGRIKKKIGLKAKVKKLRRKAFFNLKKAINKPFLRFFVFKSHTLFYVIMYLIVLSIYFFNTANNC